AGRRSSRRYGPPSPTRAWPPVSRHRRVAPADGWHGPAARTTLVVAPGRRPRGPCRRVAPDGSKPNSLGPRPRGLPLAPPPAIRQSPAPAPHQITSEAGVALQRRPRSVAPAPPGCVTPAPCSGYPAGGRLLTGI